MGTGQPELAGDLGREVRSHDSDEQEFQEAVPAKLSPHSCGFLAHVTA